MRLIDVDARIAEIKTAYCTGCENYGAIKCCSCWVDDAIELLEDAPAVEPIVCGNCGHTAFRDVGRKNSLYCWECGSKIWSEEEGRV